MEAAFKIGDEVLVNSHTGDEIHGVVAGTRFDLATNLLFYVVLTKDGNIGYFSEFVLDLIENKDRFSQNGTCFHEFVNMGFTSIRMVCKHCNEERK